MRILPQLLTIAALTVVAVPLAARFMPGSHAALASVGLLAPLSAMGLVPENAEAGGGPRGGGRAIPVVAAPAEELMLRDVVSAIGSARGVQAVALAPEVSGRVLALRVQAGDRVKAGDLMAELDDEAARLALERAELVLADAQATMARVERLTGSGAASTLQRQEAELALRTADLAVQSARRDLADHRLVAPIDGVVGLIEVQAGDLISPTTEVTRIEDRSSLTIDFRVPERVAALIALDNPVEVHAVSAPNQPIEGVISAIDNRVDEASRTLRVQARIGNETDALRAGMAFRVALEFTGAIYPAVDPMAIQWGAEGAYVWVLRAGKAQQLPIRILQRNSENVLVETALQPGDLVVTEGVQALRPGAEASAVAASEAS
ncbi:efflux RND transporter periplasmic adaptor subunit [Xinfangfangia sp. CPCC 101601]|uniref:Efflux RND transporter periplasmic adaptor subunit n=1 Tax=Pseudogemmobacter lacusdianii TaxID=3069608 RepID=A0ABU0VY65_9RHOB|nr:efflux RND transporter periplasmic adaptor subunit [Xinfangfangia sp. CPCC 101601]MDQ2066130.1 efflux RND transporter periplasmic adaptor subunit [Xinfangfangia sp. CPCC 101601]